MSKLVPFKEYLELMGTVLDLIEADRTFRPNAIIGLPRGGWIPAATLAIALGIDSDRLNSVSVKRIAGPNGPIYVPDASQVASVVRKLPNFVGLIVDDTSDGGNLTETMVKLVEDHGGTARSCVIIANRHGKQPHYVAKRCNGKPPDFDWRVRS